MQQTDEDTQQADTFRQQMDTLADYFQQVRIEQMQERITKPPSLLSDVAHRVRHYLSRQFLTLASWIEPLETAAQDEEQEEANVIEAEFRVLEPDTTEH